MTFFVVEHFRHGPGPVHERFTRDGRLMPDGVRYVASWVAIDGSRCFQVVDADDRALVKAWTDRWSDLIDFEVVPAVTSQAFWEKFTAD